jgi:hypothetical protein
MRLSGCVASLLLLSVVALGQALPDLTLPSCQAIAPPLSACEIRRDTAKAVAGDLAQNHVIVFPRQFFLEKSAIGSDGPNNTNSEFVSSQEEQKKQGVHWGRLLLETFMLFSIEQAYVVHDDWAWVAGSHSENGIPFNHYWRDYKQSLSSWVNSGWSDGDPNMYGYVGHPIQGLATSYIFIQNDPKTRGVEFSKTKAYWHSRLKAAAWNALYSTQWNIGPLSEPTIEKYGTKQRSPWNADGTWPCNTKHCYTGVGQIDLVMTPLGGTGWLIGEDILDRYVTRRVESATSNRFLIDVTRCGLDPVQVGTNLLHGKRPWYRQSRDGTDLNLVQQKPKMPVVPNDSEAGASH